MLNEKILFWIDIEFLYFFIAKKLSEKEQKNLRKELADHMKSQQTLELTRRDGHTPVEDGTPLSDLTIEGGVAELEKFIEA